MARKSSTTQEQVIVVNATPLDDDEADYLMSRERERTGGGIRFEEFLKRHPRDARKFVKPLGRKPGPHWKSLLLSETEREYDGLGVAVRAAALAVLYELAADPLLKGSSAVGSHRGYYRKAFYRDQCRMIYKVSKSRHEVVVTRIRRKDEKTYVGHEQSDGTSS
jgi:hypothetical protein